MKLLATILLFSATFQFVFSQNRIDSVYNKDGYLIFPRNLSFEPVISDTSIINNSLAKVYLLFSQRDDKKEDFIRLPFTINSGGEYYQKDSIITILFKGIEDDREEVLIRLSPNQGLFTNGFEDNLGDSISVIQYSTNWDTKIINGELFYVPTDKIKIEKHKFSFGYVNVKRYPNLCDHTGRNTCIIHSKTGEITFSNVFNVKLFETDLNRDSRKELYLVSYESCQGYISIYKIDFK